MFKPNNQPNLFTFENQILSKEQQQRLSKTPEKAFYYLVFKSIREEDYKVLFSDKGSRPNVPVNVLVSAMILKERKGWSYDELMESVMFDLRTKVALGLSSIDEKPFSRATLFNFQKRLIAYEQESGINLLEKTFDSLTAKQLEELKLRTNIQRSDSTLISSNIRRYSRVQLLIEVILRLWRILDSQDKELLSKQMDSYIKLGSEKYVYGLRSRDLPHELEKLGRLYYAVYKRIKGKYSDKREFKIFERVYKEHFVVVKWSAKVKSAKELGSSILQSPDDMEATYRNKRGQESRGFSLNATETAHPENEIQLVTDIAVEQNNIDDSKIIEERIDNIVEKTPDLEEFHTDGGYGSEEVDKKFDSLGITHVTTAIKGRKSGVEIDIREVKDKQGIYKVQCPVQSVISVGVRKRNKAVFDIDKCKGCALKERCRIYRQKGRFYFTRSDYLRNKRSKNIEKIPQERRKLRANVEATIKEFKDKTKSGKLKVRGLFKARLFAYSMGISINFGRIYRYLMKNGRKLGNIFTFINNIMNRFQFSLMLVRAEKKSGTRFLASSYFYDIIRLCLL